MNNSKCDKNDSAIAFLFDLDGVLIDSESTYTKIWQKIDDTFPTGVNDFATRIKGCTLKEIVTKHFSDKDRPQVVEMLHQLEGKMHYGYENGADNLLKELRKRGVKTAIVTSSDNKKMLHLNEDLPEIFQLVDLIITGNDITNSKPDPEGYLLAAQKLEADSKKCVVFEDSLQGVKAAKASGGYVVGVAGTLPADVIAPYCDIVVNNASDIDIDEVCKVLRS